MTDRLPFVERSGVATYIRIKHGEVAETKELHGTEVLADFGPDGVLLGIEILMPVRSTALEDRVERLERLLFKSSEDQRTHLERVVDVLRNTSEPLTATEIAARTSIDPRAARMVLYTRKDRFRSVRVSRGRVKWKLNPTSATTNPTCEPPTKEAEGAEP